MSEVEHPFAVFDDPHGVDFTVGVEEEFFVVDDASGALVDDVDDVLASVEAPAGSVIDHELKRCQIEIGTAPCEDLSDVRSGLVDLRRELVRSCRASGGHLLAAGTHPSSHWSDDGGVTRSAAYERLEEHYAQLTWEQAVCGCHVHVGIRDPELLVEVMNRCRSWVPILTAISANSPFWMGADTGYASYRTEIFHRWPTAGIPEHFVDRAAYTAVVDDLLRCEAIDAPARLYWDVRPSERYPTLEFRAADTMASVDEVVTYAGLVRAIVETCHADAVALGAHEVPGPEVLRAAHWRAARFGLDDRLVDVEHRSARPAAEVIRSGLDRLRPALEARDDWTEVSAGVERSLVEGNGAARQRRTFAHHGDLGSVVDQLVRETAS